MLMPSPRQPFAVDRRKAGPAYERGKKKVVMLIDAIAGAARLAIDDLGKTLSQYFPQPKDVAAAHDPEKRTQPPLMGWHVLGD